MSVPNDWEAKLGPSKGQGFSILYKVDWWFIASITSRAVLRTHPTWKGHIPLPYEDGTVLPSQLFPHQMTVYYILNTGSKDPYFSSEVCRTPSYRDCFWTMCCIDGCLCLLIIFLLIMRRCWAGFWSFWQPLLFWSPNVWEDAAPLSPLCSITTGPTTSRVRGRSLNKPPRNTHDFSSDIASRKCLVSFLGVKTSNIFAFLRARTGEIFPYPIFYVWVTPHRVPIASSEKGWLRKMRKTDKKVLNWSLDSCTFQSSGRLIFWC